MLKKIMTGVITFTVFVYALVYLFKYPGRVYDGVQWVFGQIVIFVENV